MLAVRNLFLAHFQRGHHRGDGRDVFRSRAQAAFLFAAEQQRRDVACVRNFQKAHAARPAEFVRRAADEIAIAQSLARHLADELHGVGEKRHFVAWQIARISRHGWMTPVSLFAAMTPTRPGRVSASSVVSQSMSTTPSCVTGISFARLPK